MPSKLGKAHTEKGWNYWHVRVGPAGCRVVGTKTLKNGVKARVCCPVGKISKGRCTVGTKFKSVLYPKSQYSKSQAQKSARKFQA